MEACVGLRGRYVSGEEMEKQMLIWEAYERPKFEDILEEVISKLYPEDISLDLPTEQGQRPPTFLIL